MDGLWESLLKTLGSGLLDDLWDLGVASGVGLAGGAAGVVDLVWEVVLEAGWGVLLDGLRD